MAIGLCDKCGTVCVSTRCWQCTIADKQTEEVLDKNEFVRLKAIEQAAYDLRKSVEPLDAEAQRVPVVNLSYLYNALDSLQPE